MPKPEKHVFICTQSRPQGHPRSSCTEKQGNEVFDEFLWQLQQRNLFAKIQITSTACMGPCSEGPTVLIYPEGVMYAGVTKKDVDIIFEQHLLNDQPVERLLMSSEFWG
ncbi:MAG TPA: (2Fe-2S) ferredoxin domain-containing protein [Gammaproteobacteria bacterium]|nr:(2Fe-2S) ferredoxin domain-containing protein [Gammaproteobacteria bacterium]